MADMAVFHVSLRFMVPYGSVYTGPEKVQDTPAKIISQVLPEKVRLDPWGIYYLNADRYGDSMNIHHCGIISWTKKHGFSFLSSSYSLGNGSLGETCFTMGLEVSPSFSGTNPILVKVQTHNLAKKVSCWTEKI